MFLHGEEDGGERCLGFDVEEFKGRDFGCVLSCENYKIGMREREGNGEMREWERE